jgi:hypothetical protein
VRPSAARIVSGEVLAIFATSVPIVSATVAARGSSVALAGKRRSWPAASARGVPGGGGVVPAMTWLNAARSVR